MINAISFPSKRISNILHFARQNRKKIQNLVDQLQLIGFTPTNINGESLDRGQGLFYNGTMDIKKRMERLAAELFRHQHLYYIKSAPEISDSEYDRLFDELLELEHKYPDFAQVNSPSKRIGSDLDNTFPERQHTVPVLSLDKEYTLDQLGKWLQKSMTKLMGLRSSSTSMMASLITP